MPTPVVAAIDPLRPRQARDAAAVQEPADAVGGRLTVIAAEDATTTSADGAAQRRLDRALVSAPEATGVIADGDPSAALAGLSSAYHLIVPLLPDAADEVALVGGMETALDAEAP